MSDSRRSCMRYTSMKLFSYEGWLYGILSFISDFLILNILWFICSIPIITVGASTAALHYTAMRRIQLDDPHICYNFFHSFRINFRQTTIVWIMLLLLTACIFIDFQIGFTVQGEWPYLLLISCSLLLLPIIFTAIYIFPVIAKFENTIRRHIINSFLMSIHNFGFSVLLLILPILLILTVYFIPYLSFSLLLAPGIYAYFAGKIMLRVFGRYISDQSMQ